MILHLIADQHDDGAPLWFTVMLLFAGAVFVVYKISDSRTRQQRYKEEAERQAQTPKPSKSSGHRARRSPYMGSESRSPYYFAGSDLKFLQQEQQGIIGTLLTQKKLKLNSHNAQGVGRNKGLPADFHAPIVYIIRNKYNYKIESKLVKCGAQIRRLQ